MPTMQTSPEIPWYFGLRTPLNAGILDVTSRRKSHFDERHTTPSRLIIGNGSCQEGMFGTRTKLKMAGYEW